MADGFPTWDGMYAVNPDDPLQRSLGAALRGVRAERGLSQEALGHAAGVDDAYLGRIERGEAQPTVNVVARLAGALGVTLVELFSRAERVPPAD